MSKRDMILWGCALLSIGSLIYGLWALALTLQAVRG